MGFRIREIEPGAKLAEEIRLEALERVVPQAVVAAVGAACGGPPRRCRKLPLSVLLLVLVAMNLFTEEALSQVLIRLIQGLRFIWPDPTIQPATKGALCQARYQLGAAPVVALFHTVCRPLATPATPGAFLFGLRLVAIDGTREDVPDTPANERVFGRHRTQRGPAAFPQLVGVYLVECGTHTIVDAGFWPGRTSERVGALRLLRSVGPGMLVLWDAGLHSFEMAQRTRARDAHFLGRVPSGVRLIPIHVCSDGSSWAYLYPGTDTKRRGAVRLLVRIVEYALTDPGRPGCGEVRRLMTSLLDPTSAPALDLIDAYHERWESELTIDEVDTHQRLAQHPLRSQKPVGVLQELYGLLIAHYAIRALLVEAAAPVQLAPTRLSFVHAVRLLRAALPEFQMVVPEQRPALYQRLLHDLARCRLPQRANRINPRVVKRHVSKFPGKQPHHRSWPQLTLPFRSAVALLI